MFAVTTRVTSENKPNWHRDWLCVCENIPIVLYGNKMSIKEENEGNIYFLPLKGESSALRHFCQSKDNFEKSFFWQARKLTGDPNFKLVAMSALAPPLVRWSSTQLWQHSAPKI